MIGLFVMAAEASAAAPPAPPPLAVDYDFSCKGVASDGSRASVHASLHEENWFSGRIVGRSLTISAGAADIPAFRSIDTKPTATGISASERNGDKERYLFTLNVPKDSADLDGTLIVRRETSGDSNITSTVFAGICTMTRQGERR
jgi:hypothetical protein